MPLYDVFFWSIFFFLCGVLLASIGWKSAILIFTGFLIVGALSAWMMYPRILFLQKQKRKFFITLMFLIFAIPFGALYYTWDDMQFRDVRIVMHEKTSFIGTVVQNPLQRENVQEVIVKLHEPQKGQILLKLAHYPQVYYGEVIKFDGSIKKAEPESYARYLAKERVIGIVAFPEILTLTPSVEYTLRGALFDFRARIVSNFQRVLPSEPAVFLTGLTLGGRGQFSQELRDAMQKSGTTHLVALSGYNVTILVWAIMAFATLFFSRRMSFCIAVGALILFVLMTGAEASVVRAAIMGILVILAQHTGRIYSMRNAIACAGFFMVLINPKLLVFDIGFQLSFLALLGIVYVRPALLMFFKVQEDEKLSSWKDNLLTTLSAQLTVFPVLSSGFGVFSLTSFLANIIVLELVPTTMMFGFLLAGIGFVSYYASLFIGWVAWIFLSFELWVIRFFAHISIPLALPRAWWVVSIYYIALLFLVYSMQKRKNSIAI